MPCVDCLPGALEPGSGSGQPSMPQGGCIGGRIRCTLRTMWRSYWRRRVERATVFMLQSLDARALKDIGIDRSEIESVVYAHCGRRRGA